MNRPATNSQQPSILQQIVTQRRQRIAELAEVYSQAGLYQAIQQQQRPRRSLTGQLRRSDKGFILECKKASPSKGLIRADFDPVAIARIYQPHAAAISVLTEPDYFEGDFAYLQAVSREVQIPVLCKDFIVEPLQLYLARYFGADAVLLMLSILDDDDYRTLSDLAGKLGLEVLTEVSTEAEMHRAAALNAPVIGINHRNLHDLSIDLNRSQRLAALAPKDALLIAESGITEHSQVRALGAFVDGFLVGSHLTAQADIDRACRQLIYGEHKVCGLTSPADALMAATAGARYGGLIFAEGSPRQLTITQAKGICQQVPALDYVAVVTTDAVNDIVQLAESLPLSAIQLHGQQPLAVVEAVRQQLPTTTALWYAIDMANQEAADFFNWPVERLVLDNGRGGSGQSFDWQKLNTLTETQRQQCLLAGGIGADNVRDAMATGCRGLDLNSAVEYKPGQKDAAALNLVFTRLSHYFRSSAQTLSSLSSKDINS
ncbi:bifunctional indole-3-glycerol-phosphate synthase TrpC/phosphoribosylanthranilate isomerase TrpF [Aliidiomarina sedimenti]|uniref:Multifunctional fusion protein n=1 Tax=Aliidiomarina sedimenti TaxID=1933879 RepID=A0ABY0BWZ8_9GAMM|nr:bifunctional indole-3-glycerol-phosphate synthase TrpC/phosphoribosylanthranilate isomerase TrpF [Aliidiomarina sedimenti]RUO28881.1 bifunctional indole-3-glycerol-phosphate synthase TrpC/phosphoribosylanthranilate isomerase TrpF [Aliidiomarina sedimenti]